MQEEKSTHDFTEGQRINGRFRQYDLLEKALEKGYFELECIETLVGNNPNNGLTCTMFYLITKTNNLYTLRRYICQGSNSIPIPVSYASSSVQEVQDGRLYGLVTTSNTNLRPFRWYAVRPH